MVSFFLKRVDPNPDLCAAWRKAFRRLPRVEILQGHFEQVADFDCVVSAGNSFGLMDGGVDLSIVGFFGISILDAVQQAIIDDYLGEQPVGTCMMVRTGHSRHPFVAHTPTMRIPSDISGTDNVYCAMWALLTAIHRHNLAVEPSIRVVACPGLGTGAGGVPPEEAARQMALAYTHYLNPPTLLSWPYAKDRDSYIRVSPRPTKRLPKK